MNDLASYVGQIGHPYRWVQWLGGLDFLSDSGGNTVKASAALSNSHMESTVKALKSRVKARLTLNQQLLSLGETFVTDPIPNDYFSSTKISYLNH